MLKNFLKIVLVLLTILGTYVACNKKTTECKSCNGKPADYEKTLGISTPWGELNSKIKIWEVDKNTSQEFAVITENNESMMVELKKICENLKVKVEENVVGIVIYSEKMLSNNSKVEIQDIEAISYFFIDNKTMFHRAFEKQNTTFLENTKLFALVDGISVKDIMSSLEFYHNTKNLHSSLLFPSTRDFESEYIGKQNMLKHKLRMVLTGTNQYKIPGDENDDPKCAMICSIVQSKGICQWGPTGAWCKPPSKDPDCLKQTLVKTVTTNNLLSPLEITNFPSETSLYSFRDNFLSTSVFGSKYINYYYSFNTLGNLLSSNFTVATQTALKLISYKYLINELMNPTTNQNVVLITPPIKTDLINYITLLKNNTSNSNDIAILDDIINDINAMSGLTKSQILSTYF